MTYLFYNWTNALFLIFSTKAYSERAMTVNYNNKTLRINIFGEGIRENRRDGIMPSFFFRHSKVQLYAWSCTMNSIWFLPLENL